MTTTTLCPSAECKPRAILLGIVQASGVVSLLAKKTRIDESFVKIAAAGRDPVERDTLYNVVAHA